MPTVWINIRFHKEKAAYMMTWSNQYLTYKASAAEDVEINLARPFDSENGRWRIDQGSLFDRECF